LEPVVHQTTQVDFHNFQPRLVLPLLPLAAVQAADEVLRQWVALVLQAVAVELRCQGLEELAHLGRVTTVVLVILIVHSRAAVAVVQVPQVVHPQAMAVVDRHPP
jgi:hypothetical protein